MFSITAVDHLVVDPKLECPRPNSLFAIICHGFVSQKCAVPPSSRGPLSTGAKGFPLCILFRSSSKWGSSLRSNGKLPALRRSFAARLTVYSVRKAEISFPGNWRPEKQREKAFRAAVVVSVRLLLPHNFSLGIVRLLSFELRLAFRDLALGGFPLCTTLLGGQLWTRLHACRRRAPEI